MHNRAAGSFRDPNGFVYKKDGVIYRQINASYIEHYDLLMKSGLYQTLVDKGWLIAHAEIDTEGQHKVIQPDRVPFISYPYEWSFSQLKDAALLTLRIQRQALKHSMILKDASVYNIQFVDGKPVFIDTLSFERYEEGQSWIAYRQFCQHFLAPLLLAHYKDVRLTQLLRVYIDGVPLDLAASLLPKRSWLKMGVALHLHLHSRTQQRHADDTEVETRPLSRKSLDNIVSNLFDTINGLKWRANTTEWAKYYQGDSYSDQGLSDKKKLVARYIDKVSPEIVWDVGANTGMYSRIASEKGIETLSWDIDPGAVEINYRQIKQQKEKHLLPLVLDLTNPSPGLGWANEEREGLSARSNADMVLALALIHHLAISNNVPLGYIAEFMSELAEWLVIEFVPKDDPKVKKLLATREDIFPDYTEAGFEAAFGQLYAIDEKTKIENSQRTLYLLKAK